MNKKLLILPIFALTACATTVNNSSTTSKEESISSTSESSENKESSSKKSSKGNGMSISLVTSRDSKSSKESSIDPNALDEYEVEQLFAQAYRHDKECSEISAYTYDIVLKYYTKSEYIAKRYTNNLTYYTGEFTYTDFYSGDKLKSPYKEQLMYKNGEISDILKYDSHFINKANKFSATDEMSENYLSLGQAANAYYFYTNLKKNKNLIFDSKKIENGYYISLMYWEEPNDDGYADAGAIELTMDKNYYINDFFYTKGSYDWMYMDDVATMRKHGPAPYGEGGVILDVHEFKYGQYEEYKEDLAFPLEENFIKTVSFKNDTVKVAKSENYIDLYNYIVTDPVGGETFGCPYNNLEFTSSDKSIASVDGHYLDLNKTGTVNITVKDKITGATSSKALTITIE